MAQPKTTAKKTLSKTTKKAKASRKLSVAKHTTKKAVTKKVSKKTATKSSTAKKTAAKKMTITAKSSGKPSTTVMVSNYQGPKAGLNQDVPSITVTGTSGQTIELASLRGKKVVLYFYPKDATPGCTIEGHDFSKLYEHFKAANTEVFGISRDSIKSHEKFKETECFPFELLSDENETACSAFGVIKMKNMYGRQVRGIERSTFIIDANGKLVKECRGVKVPGHVDEVLEFVKSI